MLLCAGCTDCDLLITMALASLLKQRRPLSPLAPRVTKIATGFPSVKNVDQSLQAKIAFTGNPVRPQVVDAAAMPYATPQAGGPLHLLVFGGSQGARVMSEIVPPAIALLNPN